MRLSVDVGGTFTDLVVDDGAGLLKVYKSPTTSPDPIEGVLDVVALAAAGEGRSTQALLGATDMFIHSTTRAINAVVTGKTARTAFLTTQGHPDILLVREGGRSDAFNYRVPYPAPYVPRSLTFEVDGRIGADGRIVRPLVAASVHDIADRLKAAAEVLGQERLGDGVIGRIWRDLFSLQRPRPFSIGDMHLLLFESPAHFLGQFVEKLADGAVIKVAGILREDLSGKDCYRFSMARGFSS